MFALFQGHVYRSVNLWTINYILIFTDIHVQLGELAESRQTDVTIRDVDEDAMEILIEFCYTSHIVVEEANVQTLLPAACLLQLAEIQVCL